MIDEKFQIVLFNDGFGELLSRCDVKINLLEKQDVCSLLPVKPKMKTELYKRVFKTGFPEITQELLKIDDEEIFMEIRHIPVKIDEKVTRVITILRDITEEKKLERAKDEFVSLVSHQLRTPLTAINWYSELLADEVKKSGNKEMLDHLQDIREGSARMVDLVEAFLNTSRLELGTFVVYPEPASWKEISEQVIKDLSAQIKNKGLAQQIMI